MTSGFKSVWLKTIFIVTLVSSLLDRLNKSLNLSLYIDKTLLRSFEKLKLKFHVSINPTYSGSSNGVDDTHRLCCLEFDLCHSCFVSSDQLL